MDVSWWTANITPPGAVWCDKVYSGNICDHWHMNLDTPVTNNSTQEYVACQEVGHTLGLDHDNDADSTVEHSTCLANDEDSYVAHPGGGDKHHIWQHDVDELNANY